MKDPFWSLFERPSPFSLYQMNGIFVLNTFCSKLAYKFVTHPSSRYRGHLTKLLWLNSVKLITPNIFSFMLLFKIVLLFLNTSDQNVELLAP